MHKPKLVKVEFLGTDIVLESVRHVPVMAKGLNPFTHFECNGKGWIMVGTPDSLFGDLKDGPVELEFSRINNGEIFELKGSAVIGQNRVTRGTKLYLPGQTVLHLDHIEPDPLGIHTWRLSWTSAFIEDTRPITGIRITPV